LIGWDYGTIDDRVRPINKYVLDTPLVAGNFISITLAWDRDVEKWVGRLRSFPA
jgi:hypothetical protein